MSTITATLNSGVTPANTMYFDGSLNTMTLTQSGSPIDPFSNSTGVTLSYATTGKTYSFYHLSGGGSGTQVPGTQVTFNSTTSLTVAFRVSVVAPPGVGGALLGITLASPARDLTLQIPNDQ